MAPIKDNKRAMDILQDMLDAVRRGHERGAGQKDISIALIAMVATACGNACRTEPQQDKYLEWFVAGVETLLKAVGERETARANPLALPAGEPS